jgi:hypothetical protein
VNAIYSLGSVASDNSSDTISNSSAICHFINSSTSSNGIYLGANSTTWTISTNSFTRQQFVPLAGTLVYTAISINNADVNNFSISK